MKIVPFKQYGAETESRLPSASQDKAEQQLGTLTLNAELNPMCHLLALFGAHQIFHVSRIRVKGVG